MTDHQIQALHLIEHNTNTERGNVLVSRQAKGLLAEGLIQYDAKRHVAYKLTAAGKNALK